MKRGQGSLEYLFILTAILVIAVVVVVVVNAMFGNILFVSPVQKECLQAGGNFSSYGYCNLGEQRCSYDGVGGWSCVDVVTLKEALNQTKAGGSLL